MYSVARISVISMVLIVCACRSMENQLTGCPPFIGESLMSYHSHNWMRLDKNADQIVSVAKKLYTDNGVWPEGIDLAEREKRLSTYVFKSCKYYAIYWVYSVKKLDYIEYSFESMCLQPETKVVSSSGPGTAIYALP